MSTKSAVSLEEYLRTSFEGLDREYVDGEIVERTLPDRLHSRIQFHLAWLIGNLAMTRRLFGHTEMRSRVAPRRVRIPDLSIYAGVEPTEDVPQEPPLAAIEILSRDDRSADVTQKLLEYSAWGVRYIWLVDPRRCTLQVFAGSALTEIAALEIPEYDVRITAAEIFG